MTELCAIALTEIDEFLAGAKIVVDCAAQLAEVEPAGYQRLEVGCVEQGELELALGKDAVVGYHFLGFVGEGGC